MRDADTLPAKVGGLIIQPGIGYGPGVERFGPGWKFSRESLIADFDRVDLAGVISSSGGVPYNLGTTNFSASQTSVGINFAAAYGITDRWTVAAFLPFLYASYTLEAWLDEVDKNGDGRIDPNDPDEALANVRVKDPSLITCPGGDLNLASDFDRIIDDMPGAGYKFNIGDLRKALTSDCFDYKDPVDSESIVGGYIHGVGKRTYSGFRDLILGSKYQFYHGRNISLAAITYVIAPTGKVDDPRDLFDFNFGDGQWDAALLVGATVPLGKFRLAASTGYEIQFGDTLERRLSTLDFSNVIRDPNSGLTLEDELAQGAISEREVLDQYLDQATLIPISTKYDTAIVQRKLGDTFYVYSGLSYEVFEWLSIGVSLDFLHHFRDEITVIDSRFENTQMYQTEEELKAEVAQLEADGMITSDAARIMALKDRYSDSYERRKAAYAWHTVRGQLVAGLSLGVNTLGPFSRGEFPLPILAGISMSRFLAGQNLDTPDQLSVQVIIPIPFGDIKDPAEYGFDGDEGGGLPWP